VHPLLAIAVAVVLGTGLGAGMGALIRFMELPAFLVTLAGMFFIRGVGFVISLEAVTIKHRFYDAISDFSLQTFPVVTLVFLVALAAAIYVAHSTRFGRNIYAIGGNEQSAMLMGLPVGSTKVWLYALSGFCSSLAGVVYTFYTSSGNATAGTMLELDAIAAVVIGGTLLSGGVGYVFGTLIGVLILGLIQTIVTFEGTLSSWWTKIAIGALLLAFILAKPRSEELMRTFRGLAEPGLNPESESGLPASCLLSEVAARPDGARRLRPFRRAQRRGRL